MSSHNARHKSNVKEQTVHRIDRFYYPKAQAILDIQLPTQFPNWDRPVKVMATRLCERVPMESIKRTSNPIKAPSTKRIQQRLGPAPAAVTVSQIQVSAEPQIQEPVELKTPELPPEFRNRKPRTSPTNRQDAIRQLFVKETSTVRSVDIVPPMIENGDITVDTRSMLIRQKTYNDRQIREFEEGIERLIRCNAEVTNTPQLIDNLH